MTAAAEPVEPIGAYGSVSAGAPRGYHHGNLRAALLDAGMALLATRALDELSLREMARAVGVSATAVYRHFPDKRALLAALSGEGLAKLASAQRAAFAAAGGGPAGFEATGRAYVRFALANPALFRLIFSNPPPRDAHGARGDACDSRSGRGDALTAPLDEVGEAMALLRGNAAGLAPPGTDPDMLALRAWSLAHGLAMLMLDGQVPTAEATVDAVLDAAFVLEATGRG